MQQQQRMTTAERDALAYQRRHAPRGVLERGGERAGVGLGRLAEAIVRVVELPANIRAHRAGRPALGTRVLCWACLFIFLPGWLVLLAIASTTAQESSP